MMKNTTDLENLISKLAEKMEKEGEINEWHEFWQRLFYTANYAYLVNHFYKDQILPEKGNSILFKLFNINKENADYAIKTATNFRIMHKQSFLTIFLFNVEKILKKINENLVNKTSEKRIIPISKVLIKELKLDRTKIDVIKGPVFLRNCQHDGGIYRDNDENICIRGVNYKFEKNKTPKFSSFETISIFLEELIDVMDEIIEAYKNKKIIQIQIETSKNLTTY